MIKKIIKWGLVLLVLAYLAVFFWPQTKYEPYQVSQAYQAQIDAFHIPPMPDGWAYKKFTAKDGVKLRFGTGPINPDAKATLIVLPGFTGLLEQYGEHLTHWQEQGYNVAGIDIRGQGGSDRPLKNNPEKSWVKDFATYSDDIAALLEQEFADVTAPIILIGQSFGAHVAYRTVAAYDTDVKGMVLTVPAFQPNTGEFSFSQAQTLYTVSKLLNKTKSYAPGAGDWKPDVDDLTETINCSAAPKRVYIRDAVYVKNPDMRMGTTTYQWFGQLMISGKEMIKPEWTSKVDIPVTMLLADRDQIVVNDPPEQACAAIADCSLIMLEDSGHCVMQEVDRIIAQVYQSVDELATRLNVTNASLPIGN